MVRLTNVLFERPAKQSMFTRWLSKTDKVTFTVFVSLNAFLLYTSVYAFRKTFAVATFSNESVWDIDLKIWLVISQVVGYALSKFVGIKFISELKAMHRAKAVMMISLAALFGWALFPIVPAPYSFALLFINGLTLGVVWGIVFSYIEGREVTEALGAVLSISFIVSSGVCRTIGSSLMVDYHIPEKWMPAAASLLFVIPLVISLYLLDQTPAPTAHDELLRTKRQPMNKLDRVKFIRRFLPGIVLFIVGYMLLTAYRDFRDNFAAEVWMELGIADSPEIYTKTEIPIAILVLMIIAATMFIKNNRLALLINHLIILSGMMLIGVSTWLFEEHMISASIWMTLTGLGLYLGYVPFNSIFFERLIAAFKVIGTVGFIMYVADAFGYLGSVAVLLYKQFGSRDLSWLYFTKQSAYIISAAGMLLIFVSMIYFHYQGRKQQVY